MNRNKSKPKKKKAKPAETSYLYFTGLDPLKLAETIAKQDGKLDNIIENPNCWICKRPHVIPHGTIQRKGNKGEIISQDNRVRYLDTQMGHGQVLRIPICETCVLLISLANKKQIKLAEDITTHSTRIDG